MKRVETGPFPTSPARAGGAFQLYADLAIAADSRGGNTRALNVNSGSR